MIYTSSYWKDFCGEILGTEVHHGPSNGGSQERERHADLYENTLKAYTQLFEKSPPKDIWPSTKVRFAHLIFERVNKHQNWIIQKTKFWIKWKN